MTQQPSPYRCIVSWCDFHCEIRSNHVCDKPPTCGCLYNSDIGAIWEPTSHSAIQQEPGQQVSVIQDEDGYIEKRPVHEQQASLKDSGFNEQEIRKAIHDELRDFDLWFSGRHVCGQSPIIPEVREELHRRMRELRKGRQE